MGPLADDMGGFMPRKPLEGTTPSERSSHDHWVGVPVFVRHLQQSPTKRRTQQKRRKQAAKATGSAQRRAASASSSVAALASGIGQAKRAGVRDRYPNGLRRPQSAQGASLEPGPAGRRTKTTLGNTRQKTTPGSYPAYSYPLGKGNAKHNEQ